MYLCAFLAFYLGIASEQFTACHSLSRTGSKSEREEEDGVQRERERERKREKEKARERERERERERGERQEKGERLTTIGRWRGTVRG